MKTKTFYLENEDGGYKVIGANSLKHALAVVADQGYGRAHWSPHDFDAQGWGYTELLAYALDY